ncbi:MAG: hypothetical protein IJ681_08310 [Bacteroidales bacterium]|nr:hypothetical protein [Bacteroidales bacterium]
METKKGYNFALAFWETTTVDLEYTRRNKAIKLFENILNSADITQLVE